MIIKTERGLIPYEKTYPSAEDAVADGYSYSFTAHEVVDPKTNTPHKKAHFYSAPNSTVTHHNFAMIMED